MFSDFNTKLEHYKNLFNKYLDHSNYQLRMKRSIFDLDLLDDVVFFDLSMVILNVPSSVSITNPFMPIILHSSLS